METITEDTVLLKGMELVEKEGGDIRYVMEDQDGDEYVRLSGYDDFCTCESWYTLDEIGERFNLTGKTVDFENDDIPANHILVCECRDESDLDAFDLPVVEGPKANAPKVHIGGPVCVGCEG